MTFDKSRVGSAWAQKSLWRMLGGTGSRHYGALSIFIGDPANPGRRQRILSVSGASVRGRWPGGSCSSWPLVPVSVHCGLVAQLVRAHA